jgi:hypothetical protein
MGRTAFRTAGHLLQADPDQRAPSWRLTTSLLSGIRRGTHGDGHRATARHWLRVQRPVRENVFGAVGAGRLTAAPARGRASLFAQYRCISARGG